MLFKCDELASRTSKDLNLSSFLPSLLRQNLDKNQNLDKHSSQNISPKIFLQKNSSKKIPPKKFLPKHSFQKNPQNKSSEKIPKKFTRNFQTISQKIYIPYNALRGRKSFRACFFSICTQAIKSIV
jgi:hypothetical protein